MCHNRGRFLNNGFSCCFYCYRFRFCSNRRNAAFCLNNRRFCGDSILRRNLGFAGDFRLNSLRGFSDGRFGYDRLFGGNRRCFGNRRGDHFCNGSFSDSNRSDSFSHGGLNLLFFLLLILRTGNRVTNPHFT